MPKKVSPKTRFLILGGVVLAALVGFIIYYHAHNSNSSATEPKTEQQLGTPVSTNSSNGSNPSNQPTAPTASGGLATPQGPILNIHTVYLDSTDPKYSPDLDSTCQTITGAQCVLEVTNSGTTHTVQPTSSDGKGGFDFNWSAKTLGLTAGNWNVSVKASSGSNSASSAAEVLMVHTGTGP